MKLGTASSARLSVRCEMFGLQEKKYLKKKKRYLKNYDNMRGSFRYIMEDLSCIAY